MAARNSARSAHIRQRSFRSRLFLGAGLLVFFLLLFAVGWVFIVQEQGSVDPRSQAAVDQSYQLLIEPVEGSRPGSQAFAVIVTAQSEDAVVTGFSAEIALLPAGVIQAPSPQPTPAIVPEAGGPRQTLRRIFQKISLIPIAFAQTNSPVQVESSLGNKVSFSYSVEPGTEIAGSWIINIEGRTRQPGEEMLRGKVKVAQLQISGGQYSARFVKQSVRGYLRSVPGVETELTRANPQGFACPAVILDSCPRGYRPGRDSMSGCVTCLKQDSLRLPWQGSPGRSGEVLYSCTQIYQPVCGSDQKTYSNECEARVSGITSFISGACL